MYDTPQSSTTMTPPHNPDRPAVPAGPQRAYIVPGRFVTETRDVGTAEGPIYDTPAIEDLEGGGGPVYDTPAMDEALAAHVRGFMAALAPGTLANDAATGEQAQTDAPLYEVPVSLSIASAIARDDLSLPKRAPAPPPRPSVARAIDHARGREQYARREMHAQPHYDIGREGPRRGHIELGGAEAVET